MPLINPDVIANKQKYDSEYLQNNPDVAQAGADPYQHYIAHGRSEGRKYGQPENVTTSGLISGHSPAQPYQSKLPVLEKDKFMALFNTVPSVASLSPQEKENFYSGYISWLGSMQKGFIK